MKGAGDAYATVAKGELDNQQKLDYQSKYLQMVEEKDRRIAEFNDDLTRKGKIRDIQEVDPLKIDSEVKRTEAVGKAETGVLANREDALREGKVATEKATALGRGEAERQNLADYAGDTKARAGVRAKTSDQESNSAKATAAAASFELTQKKALADLRKRLSETKDPTEREGLDQQIRDLSGGSTKSYADMVTAGDSFRKLAANLRQQLKDDPTMSEEEQADVRRRIQLYEGQAASILGTTVDKRLGGSGGGAPKTPGGPKTPTSSRAPWERDWARNNP